MRKWLIPCAAVLLCTLVLALCGAAYADEAENITGNCTVKLCSKNFKAAKITDGLYTSYWESDKTTHPWITVSSKDPIYGLDLCFQKMPEHYQVQREKSGGEYVEQLIRPTGLVDPPIDIRPTEGQIYDLIGEINRVAERGERVLVTTLTKKWRNG